MKFLGSRERLALFGVPFGSKAVAYARVEPPPFVEGPSSSGTIANPQETDEETRPIDHAQEATDATVVPSSPNNNIAPLRSTQSEGNTELDKVGDQGKVPMRSDSLSRVPGQAGRSPSPIGSSASSSFMTADPNSRPNSPNADAASTSNVEESSGTTSGLTKDGEGEKMVIPVPIVRSPSPGPPTPPPTPPRHSLIDAVEDAGKASQNVGISVATSASS